ncbi:MAG: sugar kinase [Oscillospiraceae bacterium]|nr:sugar kinase [Oscillospiraceae bacterium]
MEVLSAGLMVSDILAQPVDPDIFEMDSQALENIAFKTGGDALNVAVNLAKLGVGAGVAGVIGDDAPGRDITAKLKAAGVNCDNVEISKKNNTSACIVLCEKSGERHFLYYGKSNHEFAETMISDEALSQISILNVGSAMALDSLDGEGLARLFWRAKRQGATTTLDLTHDSDGKWLKKVEAAFEYTDVFIPSLVEAKMVTGKEDPEDMAEFMRKYKLKIFGVKLGGKGCYVTDFKEAKIVPAFACDEVVDTTGAGDAFMAGFICALLRGFCAFDCAKLGAAASNFCIRHLGATGYLPGFESLVKFAGLG